MSKQPRFGRAPSAFENACLSANPTTSTSRTLRGGSGDWNSPILSAGTHSTTQNSMTSVVKLANFESQTWKVILLTAGARNHEVEVGKLAHEQRGVQPRFTSDDIDKLCHSDSPGKKGLGDLARPACSSSFGGTRPRSLSASWLGTPASQSWTAPPKSNCCATVPALLQGVMRNASA